MRTRHTVCRVDCKEKSAASIALHTHQRSLIFSYFPQVITIHSNTLIANV